MRISDWSSDVCSSDLVPEAGTGAFASMSFSMRRTSRPYSALAVRRIAILPLLGETPYLIAFSMIGCRISTRSEEHTSELQSLMRISYAVFCLKKKKQRYDQ